MLFFSILLIEGWMPHKNILIKIITKKHNIIVASEQKAFISKFLCFCVMVVWGGEKQENNFFASQSDVIFFMKKGNLWWYF